MTKARQQSAPHQHPAGDDVTTVDIARRIAAHVAAIVASVEDRLGHLEVLESIVNEVPINIFVKDRDGRFIMVNRSIESVLGNAEQPTLTGLTDFDLFDEATARRLFDAEQAMMRDGRIVETNEDEVILKDGTKRWHSTSKHPLRGPSGAIVGLFGVNRDVTAVRRSAILQIGQAEILELIASNGDLATIFRQIALLIEGQIDCVFASIMTVNPNGTLSLGAGPTLPPEYQDLLVDIPIGEDCGSCGTACHLREAVIVDNIPQDARWARYRDVVAGFGFQSCWSLPILVNGAAVGSFAIYSRRRRRPTEAEWQLVEVGARLARIAFERHLSEQTIRRVAEIDALTGLPNRKHLAGELTHLIAASRDRDGCIGVAFIDLDNFKLINDSLGHSAGDELLKTVSDRLNAVVGEGGIVSRLGGDEFVVAVRTESTEAALDSIRPVIAALCQPLTIAERPLSISSSVGVAVYPDHGADANTLITNADAAMYKAKRLGRNNIQMFSEELNQDARARLALTEDLRRALAEGEIIPHFQPQIDLPSRRLIGFEALVRWQHRDKGMIRPDHFIPLAESSGLIVPLGEVVLVAACRQAKLWQDAGLPPVTMSVNVSAIQFQNRIIVDQVRRALEISGLDAQWLELELTESILMENDTEATIIMLELRELGIQFAIDDFGTGFSNLAAIKKFPVHRLKIDRSFIKDIETDDDDRAITEAIIYMGQKLRMRVLAEGVETPEQLEFLKSNHCDEIQGYFISKPVPADVATELLKERALAARA